VSVLHDRETGDRLQMDFDGDGRFVITMREQGSAPVQLAFAEYQAENLLRAVLRQRYKSLPGREYMANNPLCVIDTEDGVELRVLAADRLLATLQLDNKERAELIVLLGGDPLDYSEHMRPPQDTQS